MSPDSSFTHTDRDELLRRRVSWAMLLRVVIISVLLGATLFLNYATVSAFSGPSPRFLLAIIAITYLATIGYSIWYRLGRKMQTLARVQFTVDSVICGCLAYATGGIASGFTFLFHLWVIVSAVVLGGRAAYVTSIFSSLVLMGLAALSVTGVLPLLPDQLSATLGPAASAYHLSINVLSLFLVAWLVTSLVRSMEAKDQGLADAKATTADLLALHSDVVRSLTSGLVIVDIERRVLDMNPEGRNLLELTERRVVGQPLADWFPGIVKEAGDTVLRGARGHGIALCSSGRELPVEFALTPLISAEGEPRGSVLSFNDLTRIRLLEQALEQSKRLAALGELAATLAHEVRNPLSAVSGSFQMLSANPSFPAEDRSLLTIIKLELDRIERLVLDLLEYTRPRPPEKFSTSVSRIAREVLKGFVVGQDEDMRIAARMDDDAIAELDPYQFKQIFWNLLRNAVQAVAGNGSVLFSVSRDGDGVRISVCDDGPGVPESDRARVFDPFFSTRDNGMGLGLAICARIVRDHGGTIQIFDSELGGAEFRVWIPSGKQTI